MVRWCLHLMVVEVLLGGRMVVMLLLLLGVVSYLNRPYLNRLGRHR